MNNIEEIKKSLWLTQFFFFLIMLFITIYYFKKHWKDVWKSLKNPKFRLWLWIIGILLVSFFSYFLLQIIFSRLGIYQKKPVQTDLVPKADLRFFLSACLLAPVVEECVFRWFIFKIFGKKNPFSYLISFFSFTLAHAPKMLFIYGLHPSFTIFNYGIGAIGLIFIYRLSNWDLTYPIILHFLNNFSVFLLLLLLLR